MSPSVTCVSGAVLILHRRPGKRPAKAAFSPKSEGVGQRWAPDAGPVRAGRASCAVRGVNSPFLIDLKLETHVLASAASYCFRVKIPQRWSQWRKRQNEEMEGDKSNLHHQLKAACEIGILSLPVALDSISFT